MNDKRLWQSKTFWGGIIMGLNGIAKHFGYDLGDVSMWVDAITNLAGAALVFYGRIKAVTPIKGIIKK
jgi:hypothetical protein